MILIVHYLQTRELELSFYVLLQLASPLLLSPHEVEKYPLEDKREKKIIIINKASFQIFTWDMIEL